MASAVQRTCEEHARRGELVVMAGAGVSAGWPAAVPSWNPLNEKIFHALRERIATGIEKPGVLEPLEAAVASARALNRFPPDYQAQLIEEMCGIRYFQGLQALDIEQGNAAHEAIAALAAGGALRAVVTTNFDRLIERALERLGVAFTPAFDEASFTALRADAPLPVIKVHGCVSSPASMVDTWKQRLRGRSRALVDCLAPLHDAFWVYAGFSAADLDDDDTYLGLLAGAGRSPGAVYIRFPGHPDLGIGAQKLVNAYGDRGEAPVVDVGDVLGELGAAIGAPPARAVPADAPSGLDEVEAGFVRWADALSVASAGLCVAAILEAVGEGEQAVYLLDVLVRRDGLLHERGTPDFAALRLQYGRLGGAFGRFTGTTDIQGAASNASVETRESLRRILDSDAGFAARAWLAPLQLWLNDGANANALAMEILNGFVADHWDGPQPRGAEDVVDAWICAAQVWVFDADNQTVIVLDGTAPKAIELARTAGDLVRAARVAALHLLAVAETAADLTARAASYDPVFAHVARVDDGMAFGLRSLALGRWHVRAGRGQEALDCLGSAWSFFRALGMDPWIRYLRIQQLDALAQLGRLDDADIGVKQLSPEIERFPALLSFFLWAVAQMQASAGNSDAGATYRSAVDAALASGLYHRHAVLAAALNRATQSATDR
jgi:hypothetical protein